MNRNTTNTPNLRDIMNEFENVSIHRISNTANVTYGLLLKKSKEPIANVPYDPEAINYDAVEKYLEKREIDWRNLPWEEMNTKDSRATLIKDHTRFVPGTKVFLRISPTTPAEILFKTETHIVFMLEGTSEPKAWSINTFMLNGPSMEARSKKESVEQDVAQEETTEVTEKPAKKSAKKSEAESTSN